MSTCRITHATPASAYSHSASRRWEADSNVPEADSQTCPDIAKQLIDDPDNQKIRVCFREC